MKRKIIKIHDDKCNGCGICVTACHEKAIDIVEGKARLINDIYCDGLGDCLPNCPTGAIEIIEREADEYDDDAVKARILELDKSVLVDKNYKKDNNNLTKIESSNITKELNVEKMPCGCPGSMAKSIERASRTTLEIKTKKAVDTENNISELRQWPVQLNLINTSAPYLNNANLLIAADCTAYAYGNFHKDFMQDKITVIGCPKLDDVNHYESKLADILRRNNIKSITVVRMEVPCCAGIVSAVKNAMISSQIIVPYREVTISSGGEIIK